MGLVLGRLRGKGRLEAWRRSGGFLGRGEDGGAGDVIRMRRR
jgi:hypothetical protein